MIYPITSGQCRAARALLDITQTELAARANCGLSTVVDFEKRRRDISPAAARGIQKALERSGIVFIREGRFGVGVKLAAAEPQAQEVAD